MKIRTTMRPDLEIEVSEHEAKELRSQGLLAQGFSERADSAAAGTKQAPEGKDTRGGTEGSK